MKKNVLITGRPGVGKTTLIRRLVEALPLRAAGFYTSEIREGGRRVGFSVNLLRGESTVLAHVGFRHGPRVGKYGVDVAALERLGVAEIEWAIGEADLVVIDEIGKMELLSPRFMPAVLRALDSPKLVLATVMWDGPAEVRALKARPDVLLIQMTLQNRHRLLQELLRLYREGSEQ